MNLAQFPMTKIRPAKATELPDPTKHVVPTVMAVLQDLEAEAETLRHESGSEARAKLFQAADRARAVMMIAMHTEAEIRMLVEHAVRES